MFRNGGRSIAVIKQNIAQTRLELDQVTMKQIYLQEQLSNLTAELELEKLRDEKTMSLMQQPSISLTASATTKALKGAYQPLINFDVRWAKEAEPDANSVKASNQLMDILRKRCVPRGKLLLYPVNSKRDPEPATVYAAIERTFPNTTNSEITICFLKQEPYDVWNDVEIDEKLTYVTAAYDSSGNLHNAIQNTNAIDILATKLCSASSSSGGAGTMHPRTRYPAYWMLRRATFDPRHRFPYRMWP